MHSITYGTDSIDYEIGRKPRLKNTYINVTTDGVLVKTNNQTTIKEIKEMVKRKASWIRRKIDIFKSVTVNRHITTGSRLFYMGKSYYVSILKDTNVNKITVNFTHSEFKIITPIKYSNIELNNSIEAFAIGFVLIISVTAK